MAKISDLEDLVHWSFPIHVKVVQLVTNLCDMNIYISAAHNIPQSSKSYKT